jgi:hypothetical protein
VPALCAAVAAAAAGPTAAAAAADAAVALCKLQPDDWQQQLQQLQANLLSEDRLATLPARYVAGASFFTLCGIAEMWSACLHQLVGGGGCTSTCQLLSACVITGKALVPSHIVVVA